MNLFLDFKLNLYIKYIYKYNMSKLKVLPLNIPEEKEIKKINPIMPSVPGVTLIVAPPRCGKTVLCSNILLRDEMLGKAFDEVYIYSPSIFNCKSSKYLRDNFNCSDTYTDASLQSILNKQLQFEKDGKLDDRPSICIFFDDAVNIIKKNSLITSLCSRYRHFGIDQIIISIQSYKGVPNIIRQNLSTLILMSPNSNSKQLKLIDEELDVFNGYDNFRKLFDEATNNQERYNFMMVKLDYSPVQVFSNFDKKISG
jgi:hypothetical protein